MVVSTPLHVLSRGGAIIVNDNNYNNDPEDIIFSSDDSIDAVDIDHEHVISITSLPVMSENDDENLVHHQSTRDTYPSLNLTPLFDDVVKSPRPRSSSPPSFRHNETTHAVKTDSDSDDQLPFVKPTTSDVLKCFGGNIVNSLITKQQARQKAKSLRK